MTTDTFGGVWTYALELIQALNQQGVEVVLATMGAPLRVEQRQEVQQIPGLEVFESCWKLEWMEDCWPEVQKAGQWLLQLEQQLQPDLVHLNGYVHGKLPWQNPTLVVGHSCVLSWWQAVKGQAAPASWERYQQEVTQGLQAADLVITPSAAMLVDLKQHYGLLPHGRVVPNGRSFNSLTPGVKANWVFSAGRLWDEAKNLAALEQIAPELPWPIYVAGDQKHPNGSCAQLSALRPLGRLSPQEISAWLARTAIYALPARYEPFGLSILEAGLAGCALVLGDIPSLREVWEDSALFVPPNDTQKLKATLQNLMVNASHRNQLAARARARALEFTPQRMAAGYLAAYRDLIHGHQRG